MSAICKKNLLLCLRIILVAGIIWICVRTIVSNDKIMLSFKLKLPDIRSAETEKFHKTPVNFVFECDDGRTGRSFNENFSNYLQAFRLLPGYKPDNYATLAEFPAFLTAFSDGYLTNGLRLIGHIAKYFPEQKLTVYDIGLNNDHVKQIQIKTNVLVKHFNFSAYPSNVRNLIQYRWKPLIIAQELLEHPAVLWMDSSVDWKNANISELLIRIRNKEIFPWSIMDSAGHSTFAVTTPGMLDFLNCSKEKLYDLQLGANFMLIYRTPEIVENVLKWWVLCALEPECMAPKGAQLWCRFAADKFKTYAHCHRYDQSAVNILLSKATGFRGYQNYYHSPSFGQIVRG